MLALIIRHLVCFIKPAMTNLEKDVRDFLLAKGSLQRQIMRSKAQKGETGKTKQEKTGFEGVVRQMQEHRCMFPKELEDRIKLFC